MPHVQAVIFKREYYNPDSARRWLKRHHYEPIKRVHITANYLRYRIREPDEDKYEYRMKAIDTGIKLVLGILPYQLYE